MYRAEEMENKIVVALAASRKGIGLGEIMESMQISISRAEKYLYDLVLQGRIHRTTDEKFAFGPSQLSSPERLLSYLFLGPMAVASVARVMGTTEKSLRLMAFDTGCVTFFTRGKEQMIRGPLHNLHILGAIVCNSRTESELCEYFAASVEEIRHGLQGLLIDSLVYRNMGTGMWCPCLPTTPQNPHAGMARVPIQASRQAWVY